MKTPLCNSCGVIPTGTRVCGSCRERYQKTLPSGSTVYYGLLHVSRSGMRRAYGLLAVVNGTIMRLQYMTNALGVGSYSRKVGGILVNGCGFDGGYDLVSSLSRALYGSDEALHSERLF